MGEAKSHTFYRTFVLVSFLMFLISLETAAKHDKSVVTGGTLTKEGARFDEWIEPGEDKASKKTPEDVADIYIFRAYEQPYFKIGHTTNLVRRQTEVQTGCPFPITLVRTWRVENKYQAEAAAHEALRPYNRGLQYNFQFKTEWFELEEPLTMETVVLTLNWTLEEYAV